MTEDFFDGLTAQVKEEVIRNYLTQRRLVEEQIIMLSEDAEKVVAAARDFKKRVQRMYHFLQIDEQIERFRKLAGLDDDQLSAAALGVEPAREVRFIPVRSLTSRGKFRKLVFTAYERLVQWATDYRETYDGFRAECTAVNANIQKFQRDFDLLALLGFLKSLDIGNVERKQFLGDNFTSRETLSVEEKLMIRTVGFDSFHLMKPPSPPAAERMRAHLHRIAEQVFAANEKAVRKMMA